MEAASTDRERPFPGPALAERVAGRGDRAWFHESGRRSVQDLERVLAVAGKDLTSFGDVLDFGCGPGRMLVWLDAVAARGARVTGTDIDAEAVAWAREHLPWARLAVNDALPPLPFADGEFDLVFNHSVFTHIDAERQDRWLAELHRVTRPGALLVLTVHGEDAFAAAQAQYAAAGGDPAPRRRALERDGILFLDDGATTSGPYPEWYSTTFHTLGYVFGHWSRWFRIRAYVRQGALQFQDSVLLERRARGDEEDPYVRRAAEPAAAADALGRAARLVAAGPPVAGPSRYGALALAWRRALRRLLRNAALHQREVDESLLAALREHAERLARLERRPPR